MGLTFNVWHCYVFCYVSWSAVVESHGARNQKTVSTLFHSSGEIYNRRWRKNEHPVWSYKLRSTGCDRKYRRQKWKVFQCGWSRESRKADDSPATAAFRWTHKHSQRKQPTFCNTTTCFSSKWRLRNECRNSILMTLHYPDLGSSSDWLCPAGNLL